MSVLCERAPGWRSKSGPTHPIALTVLLCPEYRAEAEFALSVMKLSMEWVCGLVGAVRSRQVQPGRASFSLTIWWPMTGILSSWKVLWYLPLTCLWASSRAAVIMLVVMPSPGRVCLVSLGGADRPLAR